MGENKVELKSIKELLEMKFFIPNYQRGYRWTEQQVKDLLNDINDFTREDKKQYEFYCVQPLVVKEMDSKDKESNKLNVNEEWYEVIDGQQRLTTIFLFLSALKKTIEAMGLPEEIYELKYQRDSAAVSFSDFLKTITNCNTINEEHIDFFNASTAYQTIQEWLADKNIVKNKGDFSNALLKYDLDNSTPKRDKANNVRFIWYQISEQEDPIKVFTRLNIGKISLTNSELIKALFLNRSNFSTENNEHLKLRQQEIASEWDSIEYALQDEEFWLFLHETGYDRPTRIDFIFDLICKQNSMELPKEILDTIGNDEYKTFRYFYEYFKLNISQIDACWKEVKRYYLTFREWFNDLELYHYVGYLVEQGEHVDNLFQDWKTCCTKDKFITKLRELIKEKIKNCNDLNMQYEINSVSKTSCRPLLLLHNIQTIINQNKAFSSKKEYELPVFYKFPFHLFKKEKWDVEHIDSNTTNDLNEDKDQKEWMKYSLLDEDLDNDTRMKIESFLLDDEDALPFEALVQEIEANNNNDWDDETKDKNKIWNFVLLDAGTNRGYGNAIFPAKRRCIIGKDQGKQYIITDNFDISVIEGKIAFIPPITKNVFLKYYNTTKANFKTWSKFDAIAYKNNILETLSDFGVKDTSNTK